MDSTEFALLLPITSRGSGGVGIRSASDVEATLKDFCEVIIFRAVRRPVNID